MPDGLDDWTCDRVELYRRLDEADGLIVLDSLSLPWDSLRSSDRDVPLGLVLPPDLAGGAIELVLGRVALRHLTPFDRVLEPRPAVRAHLSDRDGLPSPAWVLGPAEDPRQALARLGKEAATGSREAKGRWRHRAGELSRAVRSALSEQPAWDRTLVVAEDPAVADAIRAQTGVDVATLGWDKVETAGVEEYGIVVVTDIDTLAPADRVAAFRSVVGALRVPGRLVAHGIVVTDPEGGDETVEVPSITDLIDAFEGASGQGLHVEDVRALRLGREPLRRAALLSYTRIAVPVGW